MSLRQLFSIWNKFWFEPAAPTPIALYRIIVGLIMLQDALLMRLNDWRLYYSIHPIIPMKDYIAFWWGRDPRFDLFSFLPETDGCHLAFICVYILCLVFVTLGFYTRASAICVVFLNESFFNQFLLNLSGADVFLKLSMMIISVSNAGDAFSLDNLRRTWREDWRKTGFRPPIKPQWALRMVQVQVCFVYFITSLVKVAEPRWFDGSILYYITRYEDLTRLPVPYIFNNLWTSKIVGWFSLGLEFVFPWLVWINEFRYWILAWGVLFHLGIDWTVNIPLFEWIFIGAYINFVPAEDLTKLMNFIKKWICKFFGAPYVVRYSSFDVHQIKLAGVLHRLDVFGRLVIEPFSETTSKAASSGSLEVVAGGKSTLGFAAFRRLARSLPMLWPLLPLLFIPVLSLLTSRLFSFFVSFGPSAQRKLSPLKSTAGTSSR